MVTEKATVLESNGRSMIAITHIPDEPVTRGVVFVIGGPTYRVGPQRMNVEIARKLAAAGSPVLRFDFRGTGDSDGDQETPRQGADIVADIRIAVDCLFDQIPSLKEVVLWGLCRGALRIVEYAPLDQRVSGIVLLNPRVDSDQIEAIATLRQYYWQRLTDLNFYRKILAGEFSLTASSRNLFSTVNQAITRQPNSDSPASAATEQRSERSTAASSGLRSDVSVQKLVERGLRAFRGRLLIILGGGDLEATKFKAIMRQSKVVQRRIGKPGFDVYELPEANHTFSTVAWRDQVLAWTADWIDTSRRN